MQHKFRINYLTKKIKLTFKKNIEDSCWHINTKFLKAFLLIKIVGFYVIHGDQFVYIIHPTGPKVRLSRYPSNKIQFHSYCLGNNILTFIWVN